MGRMYGKGKGVAGSSLPYKRTPPAWLKVGTRDIVKTIVTLARKGMNPSMIGMHLRDSMGIPQVKQITGRKIVRILKQHKLAPELPEDLYCLTKRAVSMRKHLERSRKDMDTKYRLILVESRIHRLVRYYKRTKSVPANFRYESATASTLVA
jgi:small subunit ribosomal protein S13e|eukprot:TRINITY_DN424_c0_g1_i2.p1 TRINITY_DN424_c0_g1~~TRINITY_DN424_c0_g1_i2.p1  ORF type:complete len:152 (-),score=58.42 TRINITY_DN424_c0_g1_i2:220-675(-)